MLNLKEPFNDAVRAFQEAGKRVHVSPLPSVVYMLQRDVINHYRHALMHYLTVDLSSPFLQNSSHGTPYQKWAKFTNEDFDRLFFSISNLLRYTARLIEDMEERHGELTELTNRYISWLVDIRFGRIFIGVRCEQDNRVSLMSLPVPPPPPGTTFRTNSIAIQDGSARKEGLQRVQADGQTELTSLMEIHETFAALCKQYYSQHAIIAPFEKMHELYYI
jgi:hypothetical protein